MSIGSPLLYMKSGRLCYCKGAVCPSLHMFLLFKKFSQFLLLSKSLPTLHCCLALGVLGSLGKWKVSVSTVGTEYDENKGKTRYFQPSELPVQGIAGTLSWCSRQLNIDCHSSEKKDMKSY